MRLGAKVLCAKFVGVESSDFVLKISGYILDDPLVNFAGHFVAEECDSSAIGVVAGWAANIWQGCVCMAVLLPRRERVDVSG
jgi:hypothetical protein